MSRPHMHDVPHVPHVPHDLLRAEELPLDSRTWTRRDWLTSHALGFAVLIPRMERWHRHALQASQASRQSESVAQATRVAHQSVPLDPTPWQALAQRAVEAATAAGAHYADARLTRRVVHSYGCVQPSLTLDNELIGVGVRALVGGYWGFSASTVLTPDEVARLGQDAVAQAKASAKGSPWTVELGTIPVATGSWATPIRIDPFTISIEEKEDMIRYWKDCIRGAGLVHNLDGRNDTLTFLREERVVATSDGARFTQTCFQTQGALTIGLLGSSSGLQGVVFGDGITQGVHGLDWAGAGWEVFVDAKIPEQLSSGQIQHELEAKAAIQPKPVQLGKYTLVCDGATMAALTEIGLGVGTQLDRALGYEANASGTSWIDDPLGMVGSAQVTSSLVTVTANRSAPHDLATVQWDDEGVVPEDFTLIKDGVLVDFQTTREQSAWLAPYYTKHGRPVRSHGCATAESAHVSPLQHMPNLSLLPSASAARLEDLVSNVSQGILVEKGVLLEIDAQGRTGLLFGDMREIRSGRLGRGLSGGSVLMDTQNLWHNVTAIGGPATQGVLSRSSLFHTRYDLESLIQDYAFTWLMKGQPPQATGHTVRAAAATIANQPVINPTKRL